VCLGSVTEDELHDEVCGCNRCAADVTSLLACGAVSVGRPAIPDVSKNRRVKKSKIFLGLLGDEDEDVTETTRPATQCRIPQDP